ncbi:MAG: cytochrome c [Actinomycetota bacterium]|nr:cytochrome c [Actinomycetota bacterium]
MNKNSLLITGLVFIAVGVVGLIVSGFWYGSNGWSGWGGMMGGQGMMGGGARPSSFSSNGERIYYTATSDSGDNISASMGGMTMASPMMSCVNCHGQDGQGGRVSMPMGTFTAADITYKQLTQREKPPFTDELIKRAITKGLDQKGRRLSTMMPRWKMSDQDLNDLVEYLKTLD